MDFAAVTPRLLRLLEYAPAVVALALNALAHDRWLFNGPLMLAVVLFAARDVSFEHHSGRMLLAGAAGVAVGVLAFFVAPPPPGPIPPPLLSPLALGLGAVSAFCAATRKWEFSLVYALLLAVLSANAPTPGASLSWGALAAACFGALFARARLWQTGKVGVAMALVMPLAVVGLTLPIARLLFASEGWLMETLASVTGGGGVRLLEPSSLDLPARTDAPLSLDPLFELEGKRPRYLRTGVLESFDGRRWWERQQTREATLSLPGGGEDPLVLSFLRPLGRALPAPAGVRGVDGASAELRGGFVLRADTAPGKPVRLWRGKEELPLEAPPGDEQLALPEAVAAELAPMARELVAGAPTARARALAVEAFFTSSFEYSLSVDLKGEGHPLALLVKEKRPAYCAYFASAMVALLRTQGTHARVVTGFAPAESNGLTGRTLVRERDAHAWVEVYLPEEGRWAPFDPTPWRSRDAALEVERASGLGADLGGALFSALRRAWAQVRYQPLAAAVAVASSPVTWGLVALAALWVFRRRLVPGAKKERALKVAPVEPRLREAYQRYARLLARVGLLRAPHETDDELLARLAPVAGAEAAAAAERFVQAFRRERFRAPEAAPLDEALQSLDAALSAARSAAPPGGPR